MVTSDDDLGAGPALAWGAAERGAQAFRRLSRTPSMFALGGCEC